MATKTRHYSDYLNMACALIGVPTDRLSTEMAEVLRVNWNSAFSRVYQWAPWLDVCPYGEARFVGNKFSYPNDLSKTSEWTANATTVTGSALANPLDGRVTASKLLETSSTAAHGVTHSALTIIPSTSYIYSAYIRPNGRSYAYLSFNDGDLNHTCFFNVTTGALGTASNCTATLQNVGSGFYLCSMTFTTSTSISATTSAITIQASTDGSTLSYAGDTSKGLYVWGALVQQTTNTGLTDALVAFDQTGENRMEAVFQVWKDNPFNATLPREQGYSLTPSGIQIISSSVVSYPTVSSSGVTIATTQSNPVFVYYRKQQPDFTGATYDSTATYAVDDQVYFTDSDSNSDYYICVAAASAGDTPETDPDKWDVLEIPEAFFYPSAMFAYSDWLLSDGQADKSAASFQLAQNRLDDACERETRQMARDALPLRVSTHTTSQQRT